MRVRFWLVSVVILSGCPLIELPSDGGVDEGEDARNSDCGDAGECQDGDKGPRLPHIGTAGSGSDDGAAGAAGDEPRDPVIGLDAGVSVNPREPVGGDTVDGSEFVEAMEDLNRSICACSAMTYDQCTDTTAEQRACEAENAEAHVADAGAWMACMVQYLHEQAACVRAAACNLEAINRCEIVAEAGTGDPFVAHCGEVPSALEQGSQACSGAPSDQAFPCFAGGDVPVEWVCDGVADCSDGSDESTTVCGSGQQFPCGDGTAVPVEWVCDGEPDCTSGSDEVDCASTEFDCGDGVIIPSQWVCDAEADCPNASDEASCESSDI